MSKQREAMLWSIAITAAITLGLVMVWAAIAVAFSQRNLAPLYFAAIHYHQDDYSAESVNAVRLNPLDPGLEQEVLNEDQARGNPVSNISYQMPTPMVTPKPSKKRAPMIAPEPSQPPAPTVAPEPPNPPAPTVVPEPPNPPAPTVAPKPDKTPKPDKLPKPDKPPKPDK